MFTSWEPRRVTLAERDFTFFSYEHLLDAITKVNTGVHQISTYCSDTKGVMIRHDVDRRPQKALIMGKIEATRGIGATYYFRDVPESFSPPIMDELTSMGHEMGFHYESLSLAAKELGYSRSLLRIIDKQLRPHLIMRLSHQNDPREHDLMSVFDDTTKKSVLRLFNLGIKLFDASIKKFRSSWDIRSAVMHGRPEVPIDNRLLWLLFDYREHGVNLEPYFDIDYTKFVYITDAGRAWGDTNANQRDKVQGIKAEIRSIEDIIDLLGSGDQSLVLNIHPEHWTNDPLEWQKIKYVRTMKNHVKKILLSNKG